MKQLRICIILFVTMTVVISSCSKKCDCPAPTTPTKTSLLINKNWQIIMHTEKVGNEVPVNIFATTSDCEKDNFLIFSATSTSSTSGNVLSKVNTKCNDKESDGTVLWVFNTEQTEIIVEGISYKIEELTNSLLKISTSTTTNGKTTVEIITFASIN